MVIVRQFSRACPGVPGFMTEISAGRGAAGL
jgi:hypothetical protein